MTDAGSPFALTVPLPSGAAMPLLGFGTWQITGAAASDAVGHALAAGYRHLDTATVYRNEDRVGAGVAGSGVPRDELFITTKIPPDRAGAWRGTLEASLRALGTDHVDLWLIHWPPSSGVAVPLWRSLLTARREGLARAVGVSNYSLEQLDALADATGEMPAVNQIEWGPFLYDRVVVDGHRQRGVVLEGYSPFQSSRLDHPVLIEIAERHGKTAPQIIIGWHLQHGFVAIPKSANRERIEANADVADLRLSEEEMSRLDGLGGAR